MGSSRCLGGRRDLVRSGTAARASTLNVGSHRDSPPRQFAVKADSRVRARVESMGLAGPEPARHTRADARPAWRWGSRRGRLWMRHPPPASAPTLRSADRRIRHGSARTVPAPIQVAARPAVSCEARPGRANGMIPGPVFSRVYPDPRQPTSSRHRLTPPASPVFAGSRRADPRAAVVIRSPCSFVAWTYSSNTAQARRQAAGTCSIHLSSGQGQKVSVGATLSPAAQLRAHGARRCQQAVRPPGAVP